MHNARVGAGVVIHQQIRMLAVRTIVSIIITNTLLRFYRQVWVEIPTLLLPSRVIC